MNRHTIRPVSAGWFLILRVRTAFCDVDVDVDVDVFARVESRIGRCVWFEGEIIDR
jgi:hypothetical protein